MAIVPRPGGPRPGAGVSESPESVRWGIGVTSEAPGNSIDLSYKQHSGRDLVGTQGLDGGVQPRRCQLVIPKRREHNLALPWCEVICHGAKSRLISTDPEADQT